MSWSDIAAMLAILVATITAIATWRRTRAENLRDQLSSDVDLSHAAADLLKPYQEEVRRLREQAAEVEILKAELAEERKQRIDLEVRVTALEDDNKVLRKINDRLLAENKALRERVVELEIGSEL